MIDEEKLEKLGEILKKLEKPALLKCRKIFIKNNILSEMQVPVILYIRRLVKELCLDISRHVAIKERVFSLLEDTSQKRFFLSSFFSFTRKFVSVALLLAIVFSVFMMLNVNTRVVMAETFTVLSDFSGNVSVERDGKNVTVSKGMEIFERDKLVTGDDGFLTVKFFDDSVGRLASNTEVVVNKLFRPAQSSVSSYVDVSVLSGVMWSRVVNLVESQSSFVVQAVNVSTIAKRAAFNVEVEGTNVEIGVFKNAVDVRTSEKVNKVFRGQKAVFKDENKVEVSDISNQEKGVSWIEENLTNDQKYLVDVEQKLVAAKAESLGVKDVSDVKFGNSLGENALLFLTFDDVKEQKMKLDLAEKDFVAAGLKLNDPTLSPDDKKKAEDALVVFSGSVRAFYDFVDGVRLTDSKYADELDSYVKDKILTQKKGMSLVLPGSSIYEVKQIVDGLELLTAKDETEFAKIKYEQSFSKLAEAEEVSDRGDSELASAAVDQYKESVSDVVKIVDSISEENASVKKELATDVVQDLDLVKSMDVVTEQDVLDLKDDLAEASPAVQEAVKEKEVAENVEQQQVDEVVLDENFKDDSKSDVEPNGDEYGVKIDGDKPLPPLLY